MHMVMIIKYMYVWSILFSGSWFMDRTFPLILHWFSIYQHLCILSGSWNSKSIILLKFVSYKQKLNISLISNDMINIMLLWPACTNSCFFPKNFSSFSVLLISLNKNDSLKLIACYARTGISSLINQYHFFFLLWMTIPVNTSDVFTYVNFVHTT